MRAERLLNKPEFAAHRSHQESQRSRCPPTPGPDPGPLSVSSSSLSHCGPSPSSGCLLGSAERWFWGDGPPWSAWSAQSLLETSVGWPTPALMLPLGDKTDTACFFPPNKVPEVQLWPFPQFLLTCFQSLICPRWKHIKRVSLSGFLCNLVGKPWINKAFFYLVPLVCLRLLKWITTRQGPLQHTSRNWTALFIYEEPKEDILHTSGRRMEKVQRRAAWVTCRLSAAGGCAVQVSTRPGISCCNDFHSISLPTGKRAQSPFSSNSEKSGLTGMQSLGSRILRLR